jgi:hypothetical protein
MLPDDAEPGSQRSLAAVHAGDRVRIEHILFDGLRTECAGLGLTEGAVVRCRRASATHLVLATEAGSSILVEADAARFIAVSVTGG